MYSFPKARAADIPNSGSLFQEFAKNLETLLHTLLLSSNGWLKKCRQRPKIVYHIVSGEELFVS